MAKSVTAEVKKRNQYAYDKKSYGHIHLQVKKGKKALIQDVAAQQGQSINGYIKTAVETKIKADTGKDAEL